MPVDCGHSSAVPLHTGKCSTEILSRDIYTLTDQERQEWRVFLDCGGIDSMNRNSEVMTDFVTAKPKIAGFCLSKHLDKRCPFHI